MSFTNLHEKYSNYHYCTVRQCKNTSIKTPGKLWIRVPRDKNMRYTWLTLAKRDPDSLSTVTVMYFCEDHFDLENDMQNYRQYKIMGSVKRIRMKPNCIPSRFAWQIDRKYKHTLTPDEHVMPVSKDRQIYSIEMSTSSFHQELLSKEETLPSCTYHEMEFHDKAVQVVQHNIPFCDKGVQVQPLSMAPMYTAAHKYKPSTLWSLYSMLKTTWLAKNEINISEYKKLREHLRNRSQWFCCTKSKGFTKKEVYDFLKNAPDDECLLLKYATVKVPRQQASTKNIKELANLEPSTIIARVYHYLQLEYEYLREAALGLPLSNILRRTAEATGVTEETVQTILQQEWRYKTNILLNSKEHGKKLVMKTKEKALTTKHNIFHIPEVAIPIQLPDNSQRQETKEEEEDIEENSSEEITIKFEAEDVQLIRPHIQNYQEMDFTTDLEQNTEYLDPELIETKPKIEMDTTFETFQPDFENTETEQPGQNAGYSKRSVARKKNYSKERIELGTSGAYPKVALLDTNSEYLRHLWGNKDEKKT